MKIVEALKEFNFEQHIQGLSEEYITLCNWRMNDWKTFTIDELNVDDVTEVTEKHIKLYIRYRQRLDRENNITINNRLATIKVFFNFIVEMDVINKEDNPAIDIKNLKEGRTVITTFTETIDCYLLRDWLYSYRFQCSRPSDNIVNHFTKSFIMNC